MGKGNGSIIQEKGDRYCWICGTCKELENHHCWHGPNRKLADEDGLVVWLCHECHAELHGRGKYDKHLMWLAQERWISNAWVHKYWMDNPSRAREAFRERYGKLVEKPDDGVIDYFYGSSGWRGQRNKEGMEAACGAPRSRC